MPKRLQIQKRQVAPHTPNIGGGHGGHSKIMPIEECYCGDHVLIWQLQGKIGETRCYRMGGCFIMNSLEPIAGMDRLAYHMSISHPKHYPTWDMVAAARYALIPNEITMVMVLPPREEYVNIHEFCFQLWCAEGAYFKMLNGEG